MRTAVKAIVLIASIAMPGLAHATESISYTYDANGRLVKVVHSGSVNNGVTTTYTIDKADNRTNVTTSGA